MIVHPRSYVDGRWDLSGGRLLPVIDPSDGRQLSSVALGDSSDVDRAVDAAERAFFSFAETTKAQRVDLLRAILESYGRRSEELAQTLSREVGVPITFSRSAQVPIGAAHLRQMIETLTAFDFDVLREGTLVCREPIGVCGVITPWNWPPNQILCNVAPALAAGCTVVIKPSELAPGTARLLAEILHEAGTPPGVFNLVNGVGSDVGQAIARHPRVAMLSFTGSTAAGIAVAKAGADTVKRIHQELGGKSANIVLPGVDLERVVARGVRDCFSNSGQSCNAPTRMLVPRDLHDRAARIAGDTADSIAVGRPDDIATEMGPVVSTGQYDRIQRLIGIGIAEGARLVSGGLGRPEGLEAGHYVRPTVFAGVTPAMSIAKEEVFGPVLSVMPYDTVDDAVRIANDSIYGLAAYVQSPDKALAIRVAKLMRAGTVYVNGPEWDPQAPFGGYKQSGNGREYADFGLDEYLEVKGIVGHGRSVVEGPDPAPGRHACVPARSSA